MILKTGELIGHRLEALLDVFGQFQSRLRVHCPQLFFGESAGHFFTKPRITRLLASFDGTGKSGLEIHKRHDQEHKVLSDSRQPAGVRQ